MAPAVYANKSSVELQAPEMVASGTEVSVTIKVSHKGNSFFHFTDRLAVYVNGEEFKIFEFSRKKRPEGGDFERIVTLIVNGETRIEAEANCNLHGSENKASIVIKTK